MRKSTVRNGMRLFLTAMIVILAVSFYHSLISNIFSLSAESEMRLYQWGIFSAAAIGGYGIILTTLGFVQKGTLQDAQIRIFPLFCMIIGIIFLFMYLLSTSFDTPRNYDQERLRPGETISI